MRKILWLFPEHPEKDEFLAIAGVPVREKSQGAQVIGKASRGFLRTDSLGRETLAGTILRNAYVGTLGKMLCFMPVWKDAQSFG